MIETSKEESLERYIRLIHGQPNLPAFSQHLAEVQNATRSENATLNLLTNIILKNVSLTTMVLRAANSIQYNPRGKSILSVSRAVTVMGWDAINNLALGLLVFEHFRNQSEKLKELVLLMMLTANHARQIAIRSGSRGIEEAYLCGMFRNLGELLVACYFPTEYARILDAMSRNQPEAEACQDVLRVRYEDLGKAMSRRWNLPETVAICMDSPDLSLADSEPERLRIISAFSHSLSEAVYRKDRSECEGALKSLVKKYGASLPVKENEIPAVLEAAAFEAEDTFRVARLPMDRARLNMQILAASGKGAEAAGDRRDVTPPTENRTDILNNLVKELRALLDSDEEIELNAALMMILEALYRGVGFDRVLFCLVTDDRTHIQGRLGVGADVEPLIDKFLFPISLRSGPLGSALLMKQDVILDAGAGLRYGRSTFMQVVAAPCFGILPLVVDDVVAGCLYFDSASESFSLDTRTRRTLLELRKFAVLAITRKHRQTR